MAITLPGWAEETLNLLGLPWVDVDEDALRDIADGLREFAEGLRDDRDAVTRQLSSTHAETVSQAYDALFEHWSEVSQGRMEHVFRLIEDMADGLCVGADLVVAAKLAVLGQLGATAAELAAATAAAAATFGIAAVSEGAIIAAGRTIVGNLLDQLEQDLVAKLVNEVSGDLVADIRAHLDALLYEDVARLERA